MSERAAAGRPAYTHEDFRRFREYVHRRSGIHFADTKEPELMRIVTRKAKEAGFESVRKYYEALVSEKAAAFLVENLINAVTIGETYFFRYKEQWKLLREHLLPSILRNKQQAGVRNIRVWSAGCSTGEEPYTLAIVLREMLGSSDWRPFLIATDLNVASLQVARMGIYGKWSFRSMPEEIEKRYFQQIGDKMQVRKEIRDMVTFAPLNLVTDDYPSLARGIHDLDLIFCRNVLIYFDADRIRQISNRLFNALVPGGALLLGHSEPTHLLTSQFRLVSEAGLIYCERPDVSLHAVAARLVPKPVNQHPERAERARVEQAPRDPISDARTLVARGRFQDALDLLLPIVAKQRSADSSAFVMIGEIYAGQGKYDEAREWAMKLLKADELNVEAYRLLSLVSEATGRREEAIDYARKGLFLAPESILTLYQLGSLYRGSSEPHRAEKYLRSALKLLESLAPETAIGCGELVEAGRMRDAVKSLLG